MSLQLHQEGATMAWIESHQGLRDHPKVYRLCRALTCSRAEALGMLHLLWWWALEYAPDGDLSRFTDEEIAGAMDAEPEDDCTRFDDPAKVKRALTASGFMDPDGRLHDWDQYVRGLNEAREKRKADGVRGNHLRWHRDRKNPDCPLCVAPDIGGGSLPDSGAIALTRPNPTEPDPTEPGKKGGPPAAAGEPPVPPPWRKPEKAIQGTPYRIGDKAWSAWTVAFPGLDLIAECRKAAAWEAANPKLAKVNKARFLHNWLARAQDDLTKGGGPRGARPQVGMPRPLSDSERARDERYARESQEKLAKMRAERKAQAPAVPDLSGIGKVPPKGMDEAETARRRTEALERLGVRR